MSKIINLFVLTSLTIFIIGCYDSITLNSNQINQAMNYEKITVVVDEDDGTIGQYQISKNTCSIVDDTLRGRGAKILSANYLSAVYLKVPISKIKYFEVQEKNVGKTLLLTGGIIGGTALIVALLSSGGDKESYTSSQSTWGGTKFSCPLIYTLSDTGYKLESETFAGAVFKGIEKSSYDVLYNIKPVEGLIQSKLSTPEKKLNI